MQRLVNLRLLRGEATDSRDPVIRNTIFYKVHRYWRIFHGKVAQRVHNRVAVNSRDLLDLPGRGDALRGVRGKWREKKSIKRDEGRRYALYNILMEEGRTREGEKQEWKDRGGEGEQEYIVAGL